jgi:hypothetical protein
MKLAAKIVNIFSIKQIKVNKFSMIKERILQVLEYKQIGKEIFFDKIGMTSANFRGNAKKSPLNSNAIENILSEIPDINPEWLLTGKGKMLKYTDKNPVNQSITGDNNIQTGSNSKLNAHRYNSDSPDMLRTLINEKDRLLVEKEERIKEKDAQIKEKDTQINMLLSILSNK